MYAVIQAGGKQHRVTQGEQLKLEKLAGNDGENITFDDVLLRPTFGRDAQCGRRLCIRKNSETWERQENRCVYV